MEAIIAIGANVGDPVANVREAVRRLQVLGKLVETSDLYLTKPWGIAAQPDFINAVAVLDVDISARELLRALKSIENEMGRLTRVRWGPRIIDLDILFFGEESIDHSDLIVPHPRWSDRAFVLVPLAQIRPEFAPFLERLPQLDRSEVKRLEPL